MPAVLQGLTSGTSCSSLTSQILMIFSPVSEQDQVQGNAGQGQVENPFDQGSDGHEVWQHHS